MTKHILFSPISGILVTNGKPIAGASVTRWYKGGFWGKEGSETVTTDATGSFSFPQVSFRSIIANILPHEAVITQKITAVVNGIETIIYYMVKRNYSYNGEYNGLALDFVFDPTEEPSFIGEDPSISVTLAKK
jgi:hypothetical protein